MKINFFKYQGTGNDFIILDNRSGTFSKLTSDQIRKLCDRRFGVGADGLMMLNEKQGYDFEMGYYNADGKAGTMCGNGGRCMVKFIFDLGIQKSLYRFWAIDGEHEATIDEEGIVSLKMQNVNKVEKHNGHFILNTGSPHYIKLVNNLSELDVFAKGREIRYGKEYKEEGINVNFVEQSGKPDKISVRTYERGVENETLSCGTGVTAAAIVCHHNEKGFNEVEVQTPGGLLTVEYVRLDNDHYRDIWLCGPAEKVFEGIIHLPD